MVNLTKSLPKGTFIRNGGVHVFVSAVNLKKKKRNLCVKILEIICNDNYRSAIAQNMSLQAYNTYKAIRFTILHKLLSCLLVKILCHRTDEPKQSKPVCVCVYIWTATTMRITTLIVKYQSIVETCELRESRILQIRV